MKWILLIGLVLTTGLVTAQSAHKELRRGDREYKENDMNAAEEAYRRALESENSAQGSYNLGNTIYKQGRYGEAIKHFEKAAEEGQAPEARANAFHNLGNAYFQQQEYEKSIEAYKNALRLNPNDMETKVNLAQAMRLLPPPAPQQQQQEGEGEENEEQEQNQDQQQDQQNEQSSGQEQQDQQQQQQDNSEDQQQQAAAGQPSDDEREISKEEAERLLEIMANEEQKTMEKLRQAQSKACGSSKEW